MANSEIKLGASGGEVVLDVINRHLQVKHIETTREKRTVDGTMQKDKIYEKKEFFLSYQHITGTALYQLINIYNTIDQPMSLIITDGTDGNGGSETYTVFMGLSGRDRYRSQDDGLWTGVNFQFKEA